MTIQENHYAIVANGKTTAINALLPLIKRHKHIIAADGGLAHLHALHITPELIVGDLDSVSKELLSQYERVPKRTFPTDKDASDLALAVDIAFSEGAQEVTIYAALNGRIDHTLSNVFLLSTKPGRIHIESEQEQLTAISGSVTFPTHPGEVISFFPLGDKVENVTTQGLQWNLQNQKVDSGFFSLSNVATGSFVTIDTGSGVLLLILQK